MDCIINSKPSLSEIDISLSNVITEMGYGDENIPNGLVRSITSIIRPFFKNHNS